MEACYERVCEYARETAILASVEALLGWDERTLLPSKAGSYRADQLTYLAGLVHRHRTAPQLGDWLEELIEGPLAADPHSDSGCTIRHLKRDFDKRTKLPQELVEAITKAAVLGQQAWVRARQDDDFGSFQGNLEELVNLKKQEADAVGHDNCRYDALLDDYEPDEKTENVRRALEGLRAELVPLVAAIADSGTSPRHDFLHREFMEAGQATLGRQAAKAIGFDFERGRLDTTDHPFCSEMGPDDIRITTRYHLEYFPAAFFGTLHEAGHGIYEQGLRGECYGLPTGTYASLGIHESQSRLWENAVGRSKEFWEYFFPHFRSTFPDVCSDVSCDEVYRAVNRVGPSLIRIEADEATYNLHIIIRFELEQALLNEELRVADLPSAWNDKYQEYLGITPPSDADGVLQDIHWSSGALGYFPTYSLGNLYAAQFFEQADQDLGGLGDQFRTGNFTPLKEWLNTNIHQFGRSYSAAELVERVTGAPLSHKPLMTYLKGKLGEIYQLHD